MRASSAAGEYRHREAKEWVGPFSCPMGGERASQRDFGDANVDEEEARLGRWKRARGEPSRSCQLSVAGVVDPPPATTPVP
eukprot:scaffold177195_cov32-Tisochrysis_lutea.AAC.2